MRKAAVFLLALVLVLACPITVLGQDLPIIPIGPTVKINELSLTLDGEIGLVYHMQVPSTYLSGYAVLTCGQNTPVQVNIADCPTDAGGKYTVTYYLSAIELSQPVSVKVYSQSGTLLASKSKSASEYAALVLADENSTEQEIAVVKALINYGHYAQLACAEYCGWTVGEDYAATAAYGAPTADESVFDGYKLNFGDYSISLQLALDYKTDLNIYIKADTQPAVTVNGIPAESPEKCGGKYKLAIGKINALHLGDTYQVCINGGTVFTVSPLTYGALAMTGATENTRLAMLSLYEFYQATCAYNGECA